MLLIHSLIPVSFSPLNSADLDLYMAIASAASAEVLTDLLTSGTKRANVTRWLVQCQSTAADLAASAPGAGTVAVDLDGLVSIAPAAQPVPFFFDGEEDEAAVAAAAAAAKPSTGAAKGGKGGDAKKQGGGGAGAGAAAAGGELTEEQKKAAAEKRAKAKAEKAAKRVRLLRRSNICHAGCIIIHGKERRLLYFVIEGQTFIIILLILSLR